MAKPNPKPSIPQALHRPRSLQRTTPRGPRLTVGASLRATTPTEVVRPDAQVPGALDRELCLRRRCARLSVLNQAPSRPSAPPIRPRARGRARLTSKLRRPGRPPGDAPEGKRCAGREGGAQRRLRFRMPGAAAPLWRQVQQCQAKRARANQRREDPAARPQRRTPTAQPTSSADEPVPTGPTLTASRQRRATFSAQPLAARSRRAPCRA